jgi:hypothetical protein
MPKNTGPKNKRLTGAQLKGLEEIADELGYAALNPDFTQDALSGESPRALKKQNMTVEDADHRKI